MVGIYIASTMPQAGKSLVSFSLGVLLQRAGFSVGYMKPVGTLPQRVEELPGDADALVVQEILGQQASADLVTPVLAPQSLLELSLLNPDEDQLSMDRIACAYRKLSEGHDVMLVSGSGAFPFSGNFRRAGGYAVTRTLNLQTLLIERHDQQFNYDALLHLHDRLGDSLLGVVLNDVPEQHMREARELFVPYLRSRGIAVLGVIPHEPRLCAMRVVELAQGLSGCIVAANRNATRMVAGFLIGTMQVDNFMTHLRRRSECAVIVGGDRADLQLVALHENCPCIILTGNLTPGELIRKKAEKAGVPLITVREDTYAVAQAMARILKAKKLRDLDQIRTGVELVRGALDLDPVLDILGPARARAASDAAPCVC